MVAILAALFAFGPSAAPAQIALMPGGGPAPAVPAPYPGVNCDARAFLYSRNQGGGQQVWYLRNRHNGPMYYYSRAFNQDGSYAGAPNNLTSGPLPGFNTDSVFVFIDGFGAPGRVSLEWARCP